MQQTDKYELLTWNDLDNIANDIALWTNSINFIPDCIVAIARGGTFLGTLISYKLNKPIKYIGISSYTESNKQTNVEFTQYADISNFSKILVIDDIIDSGNTIKAFKDVIELNNSNCIFKYATIYATENKKQIVDFYKKIKTYKWIKFPWEA